MKWLSKIRSLWYDYPMTPKPERLYSENQHVYYEDGAVHPNYNNPEMQEKLKNQLKEYAKIKVDDKRIKDD